MSVSNVKAFFEKVAKDKALQVKLKALDKRAKENHDEAIAEIVKIASAAGIEFTPKDLAQARQARARKLTAAELQATAGGWSCQGPGGCQVDYGVRSW